MIIMINLFIFHSILFNLQTILIFQYFFKFFQILLYYFLKFKLINLV
jgi:hypothetical protein